MICGSLHVFKHECIGVARAKFALLRPVVASLIYYRRMHPRSSLDPRCRYQHSPLEIGVKRNICYAASHVKGTPNP